MTQFNWPDGYNNREIIEGRVLALKTYWNEGIEF